MIDRQAARCSSVLGILLFLLPAAGAAGQELAITRIVSHGHPVAEVEDGVVFAQHRDDGCTPEAGPTTGDDEPLAGSAGETVELEVETVTCPADDGDGDAACRWQIADTELSGSANLTAGRGTVTVTMPPEVGVYSLVLDCRPAAAPEGEAATVERTLFATYSTPMPGVSPPKAIWYRHACTFAQGARAGEEEIAVLEKVLGGLYEFGSQTWRYGNFPDSKSPYKQCTGEGSSAWCFCPGGALMLGEICNFGSCYEFSEAFDVATATLGLGGFVNVEITGENQMGFITPPGAESLDPEFTGNVDCSPNTDLSCYPYLFGSHSLRERDGL